MLETFRTVLLKGLGLRYRVRTHHLEEVAARGTKGILFLPTHPANVEPLIVVSTLWKDFQVRPFADQDGVQGPIFDALLKAARAFKIPTVAKHGQSATAKIEAVIQESIEALRKGDNVILYPAGRMLRGKLESVSGNSAVETIVKAFPEVRIVLVKTRGLWGSRTSLYSSTDPDLKAVLVQCLKDLAASGVFFMPKRPVDITLSEPSDFPRRGTRAEINAYIENAFNFDAPALVDYRFEPRFAHRLHIVPVKQGANTYSGADGSVAWFNPRSGSDVKLLMGAATGVLETDDPAVLGRLEPSDECVFYQPWREPVEGGTVRLVGATVADMLVPAGQRLAGSGVRHLFLVTGGVFRGALGAFHQALAGHPLETFGIVWHFTGDDISDVPTMVEEIAGLAAACAVRKLSLVTTAFTSRIEKQMVECFGRVPSLRECSVWEKDKASKYPRYPSPLLDALLAARV